MVLAGGGYLAWVSTREHAEADLMRRVAIAEEHALKVLDTHQLVAARVNDLVGNLSDQAIMIEEQVLHGQLAQEIKNLPQVQTALHGERGFDPRAMPLDEYITETMTLLQTHPQADEIVVERVKGFRFAERDGAYDDIYPAFNRSMAAALEQ